MFDPTNNIFKSTTTKHLAVLEVEFFLAPDQDLVTDANRQSMVSINTVLIQIFRQIFVPLFVAVRVQPVL
jgi:hypothetical protein